MYAIPKNSKVKCQKDACNNFVRLFSDYTGKIEDFSCAICLGLNYTLSNKSPILANNYTTCVTCNCQFKIMQIYRGKKPECQICRTIPPTIPSLAGTNNFIANSTNKISPPEKFSSSKKHDWTNFNYPIYSCKEKDGAWTISNKGPNDDLELDDILNTDEFAKVYFCQKGENEGNAWIFIIQREDGVYVYFNASCDYTGFDCQGAGIVYYSSDWNVFWNMCLDTNGRSFLI